MKQTKLLILSSITTILITGCSYKDNPKFFQNIDKFNLKQQQINLKESNVSNNQINIQNQKTKQSLKKIPHIKPSIDNLKITNIKYNKSLSNKQKYISINVDNIPIKDFINLVFKQILNYNYSLDNSINNIKTKITLHMKEKVSKQEFFNIVKQILNSHNIIFDKKNGIYFIKKGKPKKIEKLSDYILYGRNLPKNLDKGLTITMIIPSYYIDFTDIEWMLKKFYLPNAYIINYRKYGVLFVTDTVGNIKKALKFINLMDTPLLKNKEITLLKLNYISPKVFVSKMNSILPALGVPIARRINQNGVLMVPIDEINSILITSDRKEWLNLIDYWKSKLDTADLNTNNGKIFIYTPKYRKGSELVDLIKKLLPQFNTNSKKTIKTNIIFDKERNNLIIYTTPKIYKNIYNMLVNLDTLPKQVLIQVTIAEITLKDSLQYGLEWFLKHNNYNIGTLNNLGLGSGGIVGSVINSSQSFQAIFNMLAQKNLINILSSPKLIVLNGKSASINVGTQVPVLSSSVTTQNTGTASTQVTQSVQYRNTGIILNVTPQILSNGILSLKITQTVSDPQPNNTSSISSPIILNRSLNTEVILKSNQELLLGGLIKTNKGYTINKVPLLGDIPYLGNLFKTKSLSKEKTELIILVKPIIINNKSEADEITKTFQKLLINNE